MRLTRLLVTVALAGAAMVGLPTAAGAAVAPPKAVVVQPQWVAGTPLSYGSLSGRWWQWAFRTPLHGPRGQQSQFLAVGSTPTAVDCSYGQSGPVWFLAGTFLTPGTVVRSCTVPVGRALFFPIYNAWYDNLALPGDPPTTFTVADLRSFAADTIAQATGLGATVDGVPVSGLSPASRYRATSPVFSYTLPADSLISAGFGADFPAGTRTPPPGAVADGVYLMVALAPGRHTLRWTATSPGPAVQDITYLITVR
jgi:hypothetical protein